LRLLVDEHYPLEIARELRRLGHDVVSAAEREELASTDDEAIFEHLRAERRAILTNNHRDWRPLCAAAINAGEEHYGLVLTADRSLPRTRAAIGRFVELLDALLTANPAEDAFLNQERWLS
jgi:hypothetical protein